MESERFELSWKENVLRQYGGQRDTPAATTPNESCRKKSQPHTPNKRNSTTKAALVYSPFYNCPSGAHITPPAKRFHRVKNPFESALTERLHLPLIGSPSLFQRPNTPQLSSTHFEWTIEEVSSLKPTNVEPHETQFQDSPDPEYEAKAQMAISSYFKEQQIVPSPVDCPLRSKRIILSELNGNTPISKPGRRIRDCGTQTELTLPVNLPKFLSDALQSFANPYLASEHENGSNELNIQTSDDTALQMDSVNAKDTSLRRKLFDMHNIIVLDQECKMKMDTYIHNKHSISTENFIHEPLPVATTILGELSDAHEKSSFDSLSSIYSSDGTVFSPKSTVKDNRSAKSRDLLQNFTDIEELSPIYPPRQNIFGKRKLMKSAKNAFKSDERYRSKYNMSEQTISDQSSVLENKEKFTPERSSSPLNNCMQICNFSTDSSFNFKISRLAVNSSKCSTSSKKMSRIKTLTELDLSFQGDAQELIEENDDTQISQQGFNCSSSNSSDTPRSKRRLARCTNLSQSFSVNWLNDTEGSENLIRQFESHGSEDEKQYLNEIFPEEQSLTISSASAIPAVASCEDNKLLLKGHRSDFYRTDSGFNEMATNSSYSFFSIPPHENLCNEHINSLEDMDEVENIVCCSSTPSKNKVLINDT